MRPSFVNGNNNDSSSDLHRPYAGEAIGDEFWIPPPYAIAYHLVKEWCAKPAPWFPAAEASRL